MKQMINTMQRMACGLAAVGAVTLASQVEAGTDLWFKPLTSSATVAGPNELKELLSPWDTPEGIVQHNLMSMREVEDVILSPLQSVVRVPAGTASSMFDMLAYDDSGEYIFIPHETPLGAGVSRFDTVTRTTEILFQGDGLGPTGDWSNDYGAFDPCRFTPNRTLFLAEEWTGEGRVMEVLNPFDNAEDIVVRELNSIANVAHEGINFSEKWNDTIYYIDEWNSGAIYKFVMKRAGNYTMGQTFVLKVDAYNGNPADLWNDDSNVEAVRTGAATWVPLTTRNGRPLQGVTDPFRNGPTNDPRTNADTRGGRPAADDVGATPYGRPEDMEVSALANGNEVVYVAVTSEATVYTFEMLSRDKVMVRKLASPETPTNKGEKATSGILNSPDNLAQDALGNIYIIEDAPNRSSVGGDIWFVRDTDNDGVAESIDHFMSVGVSGSEATGMIFHPTKPTKFVVAVQHPTSTDLSQVPDGLGDAVWQFDLDYFGNEEFIEALKAATK